MAQEILSLIHISHDLRTPLTGIAGSASFIADSVKNLSEEQILSLVGDIRSDAQWLNNMVENLLNMTRISEGELVLKKQPEVVDDVVSEAYRRIERLKAVSYTHLDHGRIRPGDPRIGRRQERRYGRHYGGVRLAGRQGDGQGGRKLPR